MSEPSSGEITIGWHQAIADDCREFDLVGGWKPDPTEPLWIERRIAPLMVGGGGEITLPDACRLWVTGVYLSHPAVRLVLQADGHGDTRMFAGPWRVTAEAILPLRVESRLRVMVDAGDGTYYGTFVLRSILERLPKP